MDYRKLSEDLADRVRKAEQERDQARKERDDFKSLLARAEKHLQKLVSILERLI